MSDDLNTADQRILDELEAGARNPSWLADELDYSRQYIHQRLQVLAAGGQVDKLGHGLYELAVEPEPARDPVHDVEIPEPEVEPESKPDASDLVTRVVDDHAQHWDATKAPLEQRKRAAIAALTELEERGQMTKAEFQALEAEYPVDGYDADKWYKRNLTKGGPLKKVAEYQHGKGWVWTGEK